MLSRLLILLSFSFMVIVFSGCEAKKKTGVVLYPYAPKSSAFSEAKRLYQSQKYREALPYFEQALHAEPTNGLVHNWAGSNYFQLKRYHDAIRHLEIANRTKADPDAYRTIGDAYAQLGEHVKAVSNYQVYAKHRPNDYLPYNRMGWSYYNLKEYDNAISQFGHANFRKQMAENYHGIGLSYMKKGEFEKAIGNLRSYGKMDPNNYLPDNLLGWSSFNLKHYLEAIAHFERANTKSALFDNYQGLGMAYKHLGNYVESERSLIRARAMSDDDALRDMIDYTRVENFILQDDYKKAYEILKDRPYIGLQVGGGEEGVVVHRVIKGAPADQAGILAGDVLTSFNGILLKGKSIDEFLKGVLGKSDYASVVKVEFQRADRRLVKNVHIGITPFMKKGQGEFKATSAEQMERMHGLLKTTRSKSASASTGIHWAVIIGVSDYQDSQIPGLRYASKDAQAFYDWAVSPEGGRYAPSHVRLLLNKDATTGNMKRALFSWLKGALEEDVVTIYYAGHGSPESPDSSDNLFLLPYDTQYDNIASTGFPMWDIETALKRYIKAKKVVVIVDACHSGGVGQSFDVARRANRGLQVNRINSGFQSLSKIGDGIAVISASDDKQFSQESQQWGGGHGVFTYFLLEGLKGAADYDANDRVTLGELIPYLSEQVRRATMNAQSPIVSGRFDPALSIEK